jgi:hypothetical protein
MNNNKKLSLGLPSTHLFRAARISRLRRDFLIRSAYGPMEYIGHRAIRTLRNPAEKGIDYGLNKNNFYNNDGYIAIVTVLVIGAVMLLVGMAVVLNSINTGQGSLGEIKKEASLGYTESCAEEALLRINNDNALPTVIILPEGNCTVTINSQTGSGWDFTVSGNWSGYSKSVRVTATRGSTVAVNSWKEI